MKTTAAWPSDAADRTAAFTPIAAVEGVVEALLQAAHAAAETVAGGGEDHIAPFAAQDIEHVDEQVGHRFVFAGLAAEEEQVFTAVLLADAVDDRVERPELVVVERQAQGMAREKGDVMKEAGGRRLSAGHMGLVSWEPPIAIQDKT